MKKFMIVYLTVFALAMFSLGSLVQASTDKIISGKISNVTQKADKNGNMYMRGFVKEERQLAGTKYTVDVPVVAFSNLDTFRKDAADGEIKAIVKEQSYNGGKSYLYHTSIN